MKTKHIKQLIVIAALSIVLRSIAQQPPAANCLTNMQFVLTNPAATATWSNGILAVSLPCPSTGPYTSIDIGFVVAQCDPTTSCHCSSGNEPYTVTMPAGFTTCTFTFHPFNGDCTCSLVEEISPGETCPAFIPEDQFQPPFVP